MPRKFFADHVGPFEKFQIAHLGVLYVGAMFVRASGQNPAPWLVCTLMGWGIAGAIVAWARLVHLRRKRQTTDA